MCLSNRVVSYLAHTKDEYNVGGSLCDRKRHSDGLLQPSLFPVVITSRVAKPSARQPMSAEGVRSNRALQGPHLRRGAMFLLYSQYLGSGRGEVWRKVELFR